MIFFSLLMMSMAIFLFLSTHPVFILSIILLQTLLICINVWMMIKTSWLSFILFLIFLGGLMVLFVYIVSLASNEKFEVNIYSWNKVYTIMFSSAILFITSLFFYKNLQLLSTTMYLFNSMIFSKSLIYPTILIMFYLLFTLIVAVKISSKFEGPLRNFIK